MGDIIQLLPESVANQIAAGEVVQRPASAVKELLENAVDAGATEIRLIIREAGKALIQVIDNGCGMSERDARLCFERHATSKIRTTNDLLAIRTFGFRGEALASIASVAQVDLKSRRMDDELGSAIQIEGTQLISNQAVNCPPGTSVSVKNLFFNVPARRNFLKSNTQEFKYIMDELYRVALAQPDIQFFVYNQDKLLHQLPSGSLKQRIVSLFGAAYNQRLLPVEQTSTLVNITGYIGKPEAARKTRGEQYLFVNGRYIKSSYLNHAVDQAYQNLIPNDAYPTYFLYLELDPRIIDVNIHPTKTEVNFQDARSIYAILTVSVKQSIGKFTLTPTLDFDQEPSMNLPPLPPDHPIKPPTIKIDPEYNPFEKKQLSQLEFSYRKPSGDSSWEKLYDPLRNFHPVDENPAVFSQTDALAAEYTAEQASLGKVHQIEPGYLITGTSQGIVVIDQRHAHERILYEQFLINRDDKAASSQKLLLPQMIQLSPGDAEFLKELQSLLEQSGFEISEFGLNEFVVQATPPGIEPSQLQGLIESFIERYKSETDGFKTQGDRELAKALASKLAIKADDLLQPKEAEALVNQLFNCETPDFSPDGKPTMVLLGYPELAKKFKRST